MNYPGTPYNDHIFNRTINIQGTKERVHNNIYNGTEKESIPGYHLYSKLLKTTCSIHQEDKDIEQYQLLSLILLHYKYITVEQFHSLMPWAQPRLLSRHCCNVRNAEDKEQKRKNNKDSKKKVYLNTFQYDRNSFYYMLNNTAYKKALSLLPEEYLRENHISIYAPKALKCNIMHHVLTNNVPFRLLRDDQFSAFNWITGVVLNPRLDLEDNLSLRYEKKTLNSHQGAGSALAKKPDGIIVTETNTRTCYCIVEQDMGTEYKAQLLEKHCFYGDIFRNESHCENMTILYHSCYPKAVKRIKERDPKHGTYKTYRHSLAKLKYFMAQKSCSSIGETWFFLLAEEARKDVTSNELLTVRALKEFLSAYMSATPDRPGDDGTYEDVADFVESIEYNEEYGRNAYIYRCEKAHTEKIRSDAWEFLKTGDGATLREAILKKGLSYVIVNRIFFDRYAPALLAKESHYEEVLFDRIAYTSLLNYGMAGTADEKRGTVNGYCFRNIFSFPQGGIRITVFEEISQDLGGYARAKFFCDNYRGRGTPMNLILLAASDEEAFRFTRETKIYRFLSLDPDSPDAEFNVRVAFVNYASRKALPFIYYEKKEGWLKREFKKIEPTNTEEKLYG